MRCVLLGAGPIDRCGDIRAMLRADDFVICVDGGQRHLASLQVQPALFVGDFDSTACAPSGCQTVSFPAKKDETDMFLAACEGIKRGLSDFLLLGGTGGRLDHTLANLALLCELAETGVTATMVDGQNSVRLLLPGEYVLCGDGYEKISIFSYTERCTGVCFSGVEYPLEQATLTNTFPLGVSNEQVGDVSLSFSSGRLVLVFSKD